MNKKCCACHENERSRSSSYCLSCNRERMKGYRTSKKRKTLEERTEKLEKLVENLQKQFDSIDFEAEIDRKTLRGEVKSILMELD